MEGVIIKNRRVQICAYPHTPKISQCSYIIPIMTVYRQSKQTQKAEIIACAQVHFGGAFRLQGLFQTVPSALNF